LPYLQYVGPIWNLNKGVGAPVECPPGMDIVQIGSAASKIAAARGRRLLRRRVCFAPVVEPPYTPTAPHGGSIFAEIEAKERKE
jgi:hypothetical protein